MRTSLKSITYDILTLTAGSVLFSASVNMFILPGKIILGGATGVASVVNRLVGIPTGVLILALNIPLLLVNAKLYGYRALVKTAAGIVATSLATDLLLFFPKTLSDPLLCSLFGGLSMGAGMGMLLSRGYTTGGTDLAASIIRYRYKRFSAGKIIMICDLIIIGTLVLISKEYVGIIYSFIATYSCSYVTDAMIDGTVKAKSVFIISDKHEKIASKITDTLGRGVTVLDGYGYYTSEKKRILLCVVRKNELFELKQIVCDADNGAFVFFCDTSYVMGRGFETE